MDGHMVSTTLTFQGEAIGAICRLDRPATDAEDAAAPPVEHAGGRRGKQRLRAQRVGVAAPRGLEHLAVEQHGQRRHFVFFCAFERLETVYASPYAGALIEKLRSMIILKPVFTDLQ